MKKAIVMLALIASVFTVSAHTITPVAYCSTSGYVTFDDTAFVIGAGNTAFFYITSDGNVKSKNNTYVWTLTVNLSGYSTDALNDSVGAITTAGFLLNIPERFSKNLNNNVKVFATESNSSGTYVASVVSLSTLTNGCGLALPILLSYFYGTVNSGTVTFFFQTETESNVDHFEIVQVLGSQERTVATVYSANPNGNSQTPTSYTTSVLVSVVEKAGLSLILILLSVGIFAGSLRKSMRYVIVAILSIMAVTSCSKNTTVKPTSTSTYGVFYLKEVDKDGSVSNFNTIIVNY